MKLGTSIDALYELKLKKKEMAAEVSKVTAEITKQEKALLEELNTLDLNSASGNDATIKVSSMTVPSVKDWDLVYDYIHENSAFYLLARKLNGAPFRELLEAGQEIPGVETFTKTSLSTTKVSKT